MKFIALLFCLLAGLVHADTAETIVLLSNDISAGVRYFSNRNESAGNLGFLFAEDFDTKQVMYARPENYSWRLESSGSDRYKQLFFPRTSSYAYLQRIDTGDGYLRHIDETHYELTVDGGQCATANCKVDEIIISVVLPKRIKVTEYDASVKGIWRVVDSTFTFYSRLVKGASIRIHFEDQYAVAYDLIRNQMGEFKDIEVKSLGGAIQVAIPMDYLFTGDSAKIRTQSRKCLEQLVDSLKSAGLFEVNVEGHSDSIQLKKTSVYASTWELSAVRAAAALRVLIDSGIAPDKLSASGYGDSHPIAENSTPEGRAKNRRIVFKVMPSSGT